MRRRAGDNTYLHPDFHGALSTGIEYLHRQYGADAVREYLRDFARSFYAPVTRAIQRRGLSALKTHFDRMYRAEGVKPRIRLTRNELIVDAPKCPAVTHMRKLGYPVARLFHETGRTVNEALCEGTPFRAEWLRYDRRTGRVRMRFSRRAP